MKLHYMQKVRDDIETEYALIQLELFNQDQVLSFSSLNLTYQTKFQAYKYLGQCIKKIQKEMEKREQNRCLLKVGIGGKSKNLRVNNNGQDPEIIDLSKLENKKQFLPGGKQPFGFFEFMQGVLRASREAKELIHKFETLRIYEETEDIKAVMTAEEI